MDKSSFSQIFHFFTIIFFFCLFPYLNMQAQGDEDWLVLDARMECTITQAAQGITGDESHYANRYHAFDNELVDPALAWDWNITNPYTGDFDNWISGATFKFAEGKINSANKWWEDLGLDNKGYYDTIDVGNDGIVEYWDVKQTFNWDFPWESIDFHGEKDIVIKYRGFEGYGVEGSMWWKKGRFIFMVGNITKKTKKTLVDSFLVPSMEHIYHQAEECNLFNNIIEVGQFKYINLKDTYYHCIDDVEVFIFDKNNELVLTFEDQVTVSLFQNGILLNTWTEKGKVDSNNDYNSVRIDGEGKLPEGDYFENLNFEIRYKDVVSTSKKFNLYRVCDATFSSYPEKISYGETISISITEEELLDPDFLDCDEFDIVEVVHGWEGRVEEKEDNYTFSYTCPSESELSGATSLRFIVHRCRQYENGILDEIYIPIEDAVIGPTEGFDDVYIFGGEDDDHGASIAAGGDPTEIFITGEFAGSAAFVDTDLLSDGPNDVFIGKWNYLTNNFEWLQKIGSSTQNDSPEKVVLNVGTSEIDCVFESGDKVETNNKFIVTPPGKNIVDVRMDYNGEIKWIVASGQPGNGGIRSIESRHYGEDAISDINGNLFITGYYYDNISFTGTDGQSFWSSEGHPDHKELFLVKFSNQGELLWGFSAEGLEDVKGSKLAIDTDGNLYMAASYDESVIMDGYDFHDQRGAFIIKFSPSGEIIWLKNINEQCYINGLVLDQQEENFYICGRARHDCDFAGMVWENTEPEYTRLYYAKFSRDGEPIWIKHGETTSENEAHWPLDMAIDKQNNIYMTGYFAQGILSFSNIHLIPKNTAHTNHIIFAAAFDSDGNVLWADMAADNPIGDNDYGDDDGMGISIDDQNNCYLTGAFDKKAYFGENLITGYGNNDAFIAKVIGGKITGIDDLQESENKENLLLYQNYPNPFKESTRIDYKIKQKGKVDILVFNTLGERIKTLVSEIKSKGDYSYSFDAQDLHPGIYYYQLRTKNNRISKKMILIR